MVRTNRPGILKRSASALQRTAEQAGPAAAASYSLIGAILLLGGMGYACDRWLGTEPWCLLAGLALGLAAGFYQLAKALWWHE
jgi:F0F1-type ATP synthase assembly protein I